jgi:uncharacterized NAD(P)/FAD-binding protein YdhS
VPAAFRVAIVGAGFSGSALAMQLLKRPGVDIILIEKSGVFGRGLAYGTTCPAHLLNVRSGNMSLFPSDGGHFIRWLAARGHDPDPEGYAPRALYGAYLQDSLAEAEAAAPERLHRVSRGAVAIEPTTGGVVVRLEDGSRVEADAAVLATGNLPPVDPARGLQRLGDRYLPDPWAERALSRIGDDDPVALIGSGLTTIDVVLALVHRGWRGRAVALSRRGLLPRPHARVRKPALGALPPEQRPSELLRMIRRRAKDTSWVEVMDQLRLHGQALWLRADAAERGRFLRHGRAWWDVHRHRTAPDVGETIERLEREGRLTVAAGRIASFDRTAEGVALVYRPRGAAEPARLEAAAVINCTGPAFDLTQAVDPLLRDLFARGAARPDPLRCSLDVDEHGRVLDLAGVAQPRLFALGPLTRGRLWEIVAVPDIRLQVSAMTDMLHEEARAEDQRRQGALDSLFLRHPRAVGETYGQHMKVAFGVGAQLTLAGLACFAHGLVPAAFEKTGSNAIKRLHHRLFGRHAGLTLTGRDGDAI